jgi:hypothetical protein
VSRQYCSVCGKSHQNTWQGMCDYHLQEDELKKNDAHNQEADALNGFMALAIEDRWEAVFTFMRSRGYGND